LIPDQTEQRKVVEETRKRIGIQKIYPRKKKKRLRTKMNYMKKEKMNYGY